MAVKEEKKEKTARLHIKSSKSLLKYLRENKRDFKIEKTSTGVPTYVIGNKQFYVRDKASTNGLMQRIIQFQNQVEKSDLFFELSPDSIDSLENEITVIKKTILYKGFTFEPEEKIIHNAIKIDFSSAYWQTCRVMKVIDKFLFDDIEKNVSKPIRLRITGTLGKSVRITRYKDGERVESFKKKEKKKRSIFRNLYMRIKKLVDELMVWSYQQNPDNFIGFYVDCVWLRNYDDKLIESLKRLYNIKIEIVNLTMESNNHSKFRVIEENRANPINEQLTPYDVQFRKNQMDNYEYLHEIKLPKTSIDLTKRWKNKISTLKLEKSKVRKNF